MSLAPDDDTALRPGPRRGRPAAARAGEVEARVLDAASELFLQQGYGRTTMDQVVAAARTSKTTLYGRYPQKAGLFAAVVDRSIGAILEQMDGLPARGTPRERLVAAGLRLADITLTPDIVALMRITAAEAQTFPDIAGAGFEIGFGGLVRSIAVALAQGRTPGAVDAVTPVAARFVELAFHPLFMHAFYGADLVAVRARVPATVDEVADFVLLRRASAERAPASP